MKGKLLMLTLAALALSACTPGQGSSGPSPKPTASASSSASPAVSDAQWAAAFQAWGATQAPQRDVADFHKYFQLPAVQNLTQGKVSDADVQKWVESWARTAAINEWADDNFETQFLIQGPLVAAGGTDNVFGPDRKSILDEQTAGGTSALADPYGTFAAVGVVAVPESVKNAVKGDRKYDANAPLTDFAILDKVQGPITTYIMVNGQRKVFSQEAAGQGAELVGSGSYRVDSVLGPIWVWASVYPCQNLIELRDLCSQLR